MWHVSPSAGEMGEGASCGGREGAGPGRGGLYLPHGPGGSPGKTRHLPQVWHGPGACRAGGPPDPHRVDLSHAPGSGAGQPGNLPKMWHGARAPHCLCRRGRKSRTGQHAAPVLGVGGAHHPSGRHCHGRHGPGVSTVPGKDGISSRVGLGGTGPGHAGGAVGRLAVFCPGC